MGKKIICIVTAILVVIALFIIFATKNPKPMEKTASHKIKVVVTLFPLYEFAKNIGKERVEVSLLLPPGVEAHSFEPKPSDLIKINEADIFIYTGKFMEPWAEDIVKSVTNRNLINIDASQGTKMIHGMFHDVHEPAGSLDPHIWLDFENAKTMVGNILHALEIKDPVNTDIFKKNADDYRKKLTELDSSYKTALAPCKGKEIVYGGHYAFGYLAQRYDLKYLAAQGFSPDSEPTAKDLSMLVEQIRKDNIKYVFFEELTSPKIADTIANETNTKLLLLNAAHNVSKDQFVQGASFLDIMKSNLDNLKIGLGCP
jgi:zinc transport system substrate-binding protein